MGCLHDPAEANELGGGNAGDAALTRRPACRGVHGSAQVVYLFPCVEETPAEGILAASQINAR